MTNFVALSGFIWLDK